MLTNGTTYQTANRLDRFVGFEALLCAIFILDICKKNKTSRPSGRGSLSIPLVDPSIIFILQPALILVILLKSSPNYMDNLYNLK